MTAHGEVARIQIERRLRKVIQFSSCFSGFIVSNLLLMYFFDRFLLLLLFFFFLSCVSTTLCCYLQVVPCHLRARFHIRFKRHARRVGQVRHFLCVKNTSKTCHEDFTRKRYCKLS